VKFYADAGRTYDPVTANPPQPAYSVIQTDEERATGLLEPGKLEVAVQHELAHVAAHDNLKKLMIHSVKFPLMQQLERDWLEATEYAADDAAATSESAAVDLASALLKVASHSASTAMPELAMSLVRDADHALRARVRRLIAWQSRRTSPCHA